MTELDVGDNPLEHLHKVFVGSLYRFAGCNRGSRMGDEDIAKTHLNSGLRKINLHAIGDVEDLLISTR